MPLHSTSLHINHCISPVHNGIQKYWLFTSPHFKYYAYFPMHQQSKHIVKSNNDNDKSMVFTSAYECNYCSQEPVQNFNKNNLYIQGIYTHNFL
jgi:hypothetical protein